MLLNKNSTKSIEEENFNYYCEPSSVHLQRFESHYEQPVLFKGISEFKEDDVMGLFRKEESFVKERKMEEELSWGI